MGGIFFPFLPGSGTAGPHEKYYEALQAAAVSRYYKKPQPSHNVYHHHGKSNGIQSDGELIQPGVIPQPPITPARPQSRHMSSPPVPAVLKKIQRISKGSDSQGEKHEWENYDSTDHDAKIDKNFENLQIKERRPCTEQDKQELLARLSYLKLVLINGLPKKRAAFHIDMLHFCTFLEVGGEKNGLGSRVVGIVSITVSTMILEFSFASLNIMVHSEKASFAITYNL